MANAVKIEASAKKIKAMPKMIAAIIGPMGQMNAAAAAIPDNTAAIARRVAAIVNNELICLRIWLA